MVIYLIIIGAAAGYLATRIMKVEANVIQTVGIGIGGALIGGFIIRFLVTAGGLIGGLVGAVLGSMLLIWVWQTYGPKN